MDNELLMALRTGDVDVPYGRFVYPCRLRLTPNAQYLSVQLHGSVNRERHPLPYFPRWNWGRRLNAHVLSICDPTLYLNDKLNVGCYMGDREESALEGIIAIAARSAESLGMARRFLFSGSSGGGFAALQAAAMCPDGRAIAINPQTNLLKHWKKLGRCALLAYGCSSSEDAARVLGDRLNAVACIKKSIAGGNRPRIVYIQNVNDVKHYEEHYKPFAEVFGLSLTCPKAVSGSFMTVLYDGPGAHDGDASADLTIINRDAVPFLLGTEPVCSRRQLVVESSYAAGQIRAHVSISGGSCEGYLFSFRLFDGKKIVGKTDFREDRMFVFRIDRAGKYICRCIAKGRKSETLSAFSSLVDVADL